MSCHPTCLSSDNVPVGIGQLTWQVRPATLDAVDDADSINSRLIYETVLNGTGEQVFEWFNNQKDWQRRRVFHAAWRSQC